MRVIARAEITLSRVDDGQDGNGIISGVITYQASSDGVIVPTGEWSETIPETSVSKPYLWTKTVLTYTNGTTSTSYSVGSTINGIAIGGRNLIVQKDAAIGWVNNTGTVTSDAGYKVSGYIPVTPGDVLIFQLWPVNSQKLWIDDTYFSGESKEYIGGYDGEYITTDHVVKKYVIPENATYVRISYTWADGFKVKLERGNTPTDWTPAPEDVELEVSDLTTRVTNAETQIENNKNEINLRATTEFVETTVSTTVDNCIDKTTFEEYRKENEAELSLMANKVEISVSETVRQEIKDGDDALLALYQELRMNYDFTADGQYIGKKDSDTMMRLVNDMMQILVAGVAATTVDRNGLTADQANVKTLHMGDYTLALGEDSHLTLT